MISQTIKPSMCIYPPYRFVIAHEIEDLGGRVESRAFLYCFLDKQEFFVYAAEARLKLQDMDPGTYQLLEYVGTCREWREEFDRMVQQ